MTDDSSLEDATNRHQIELPETVRRDERFVPQITGLEPGERVTLTVSADDGTGPWSARATFEADDDGRVDLSTEEPTEGDYDRADPMGPVWSLSPDDGEARRFQPEPLDSHELTYELDAADRTAAETVTVRHADPGVERHDGGEEASGAWFEPVGEGPHPAVVVLHGSGGDPMVETAALLASRGFAAYAPQYLGVDDLPEIPREVPLEYVEAAIDWFLDHEAVRSEGYGVYGGSMGAQLSLLLAVEDDRIDAVVPDAGALYPFSNGETAAWTRDGDPFECIPIRDEPPTTWQEHTDAGTIAREVCVQMLEAASADRRQAATIPIEEAEAEFLFLSGTEDYQWPAVQFGTAAMARLDAVGYEYRYEHDVYHEAGHVIGAPYRPTTWRPGTGGGIASGGNPAAHAKAQAEAWPRVLDAFDRNLKT
jgi:dienelactone hydrolase